MEPRRARSPSSLPEAFPGAGLLWPAARRSLKVWGAFAPYVAGVLLLAAAGTKAVSLRPAALGIAGTAGWGTLIAIEGTLGLLLLFADRRQAWRRAALALFCAFTLYVVFNHFHGRGACGCGAGEQLFVTRKAQFWFSLGRNLAVILGLAAGEWEFVRTQAARLLAMGKGIGRRDSDASIKSAA